MPRRFAVAILIVSGGLAVLSAAMLLRLERTATPPSQPSLSEELRNRGLRAGTRAPAFAARSIDGRTVRSASLAGTPVVVAFFGSWCHPCRVDAPQLASAARRFAGRAAFVAFAVADTPAASRRFARRYGWRWPIVEDTGERYVRAFRVPGTPTTYVLDRRGRVAARLFGRLGHGQLARALARVVAGPAA